MDAHIASLKRTPGIARTPQKDSDTVHFEWLALHHVGRWTYEPIVERYQDVEGRPDVPAVSRAITETAQLVGLTPRVL